jgi:acetyl-CoA acetyltransferase
MTHVNLGHCQVEADLTKPPPDLTRLETTRGAVEQALSAAGIMAEQIGTVQTHDCFTIASVKATGAIGLTKPSEGPAFILAGQTATAGCRPIRPAA